MLCSFGMLSTFLSIQGSQWNELVPISYKLSASCVGLKDFVGRMKWEQLATMA